MPNYVFECSECTHSFEQFETIANMNKPLNEKCPDCGHKGSIIRLVGNTQVWILLVWVLKKYQKILMICYQI